jgi:hypothetical protein
LHVTWQSWVAAVLRPVCLTIVPAALVGSVALLALGLTDGFVAGAALAGPLYAATYAALTYTLRAQLPLASVRAAMNTRL